MIDVPLAPVGAPADRRLLDDATRAVWPSTLCPIKARPALPASSSPLAQFAEFPHLLCLSIASSSSSSERGEMLTARNPGKLSAAVVSICISST